jgi:hypothetical protein
MLKASNLAKFIRKEKLTFSKINFDEHKLALNNSSSSSAFSVVTQCPNCHHELKLSLSCGQKIEEKEEKILIPSATSNMNLEKKRKEGEKDEKVDFPSANVTGLCQFDKDKFINDSVNQHFTAAFVGPKCSGKSVAIADLASSLLTAVNVDRKGESKIDNYDDVLIFKSHQVNTVLDRKLSNVLDKECWFEDVDDKLFIHYVGRILEYQKLFGKNKILIIVDDLMGRLDKRTKCDTIVKDLFFNFRHQQWRTSILYSAQVINDILPSYRGNADYFFFFKISDKKLIRKTFELCGKEIIKMNSSTFEEVFRYFTNNYGILVYRSGVQLFWWKAKLSGESLIKD